MNLIKLFFLFVLVLPINAQVADLETAVEVKEMIVTNYNQNNFKAIYELATPEFQKGISEEGLTEFLSKQVKPLGQIVSSQLIEDLGEMKYFRLELGDSEKRRSLIMNLGVNVSKRFYSFGLRNLPKPFPPREKSLLSDNPLKNEIDLVVDKAAQRYMSNPSLAGTSIGIVKDGKFYTFNYGETEKGNGQLPKPDSFYEIGSITKTFTGILLAQAVLDKKVKLDDDIRKYLDEKYPNLEFQGQPITLRHLSTHTSALPSNTDNVDESDDAIDPWGTFSRTKLLDGLHRIKLKRKPGEEWEYSNIGVGLLGNILEKVYRMNYEKLVEKFIAKPAQMKETKINLTAAEMKRYATGHTKDGKVTAFWNVRGIEGAGALRSTVNDMLKYMQFNILEQNEAVKLSHQRALPDNEQIGLGWGMGKTVTGFQSLNHDGGTGGFRTSCFIYPKLKLGIVVLTNNGEVNVTELTNELYFRITKKITTR